MLCGEERKRERRRSVTQPPLRMKNPKVHTGHTHKKKALFLFWCLNVHLSMYQCDWLHRFSRTSVKVTRVRALILWLWYFSWIAERTMNVKSFNCSFLGRTHTHTHIHTQQHRKRSRYIPAHPRSLASLLHEQTLDGFHKKTRLQNLWSFITLQGFFLRPKVFSH